VKWLDGIKNEIDDLREELISLRRDFHQHPELGFEEHRTAEIVETYLTKNGIITSRAGGTGVVGVLEGARTGPVLMLRADLDALPVNEMADVPFKSTIEGKMHACGHDGHTAMLMVAAKILARHRDELAGSVKFVFQPNEEDAGADIIIDEGVLENPVVDAAMGLHLWSPLPSGAIGVTPGPLMASSYYFWLTIHGKGGHGGAPHLSKDPVYCANQLMNAVQSIQTREQDVLNPTLITFCQVKAGTSPIIIPDKIELAGSIRCLHDGDLEVRERFEAITAQICAIHGTTYDLTYKCGNELLDNDMEMTRLARQAALETVGKEALVENNLQVMLGEDFASFAKRVPSVFCFLGIADAEKKTDLPHHHPEFKLDEDALPLGVEMHIRSVAAYLRQQP
jgi:amidohydrolase